MGTAENLFDAATRAGERSRRGNRRGMEHVSRTDVVIFALVGLAAAVSWLGIVPRVGGIDWLAVAAVLGGGWTVFREAIENLLARRMTMELSMTLALVAALAIREFSTALFILFFVLGAEILEEMTVSRGRKAIRDLLALLPKKAVVRRGGELVEVAISEVHAGDLVVIRPAAEIPVDGVVVVGHSTVDQSSITGESMPVEKLPGAPVFAGTTNHTGNARGPDRARGPRHGVRADRRRRRKGRALARAGAETGRPPGRLGGLFRAGLGRGHISDDAQHSRHHRRDYRGRSLRHRRRHAAGSAGRHRTRGARRRRGQGRTPHGSAGNGGYGGARQDWNIDFRRAVRDRGDPYPGEDRTG